MGSEECHTVLKCTTKRFWADSGKDTKAAPAIELLRGLANAQLWDDLVHLLTDPSQPGWANIVASGAPGAHSGAPPPLPKCIANGMSVSSTAEKNLSQ